MKSSCRGKGNSVIGLRGNYDSETNSVMAVGALCATDKSMAQTIGESKGTPFEFQCPTGSFLSGVGLGSVTCRSSDGKESQHFIQGVNDNKIDLWSSKVPAFKKPEDLILTRGRVQINSVEDDIYNDNSANYKVLKDGKIQQKVKHQQITRGQVTTMPIHIPKPDRSNFILWSAIILTLLTLRYLEYRTPY